MKNTINDSPFEVRDLGLCGALLLGNFKLLNLDKTNPRKTIFLFQYEESIKQAVEDYFSNNFQVDALEFFTTLKNLKNRIYTDFQQVKGGYKNTC